MRTSGRSRQIDALASKDLCTLGLAARLWDKNEMAAATLQGAHRV